MSNILTCSCGAKVRLPEQTANRSFRCPNCKVGIALAADASVLTSSPLAAREGATCPICQSPIGSGEFWVTCPKCDQVHHRECWAEIGGCGTYGCEQAPALTKGPATQPPLSAWGDTKTCPVCKEKIKAIAVRCRYCGTDFDTVDPLSLQDLRRKIYKSEAARGLRTTVIVLFVLSLFGCPAPLVLLVSPFIVLRKRQQLAKEGPLLVVLAYSTLIVSLIYSVLMGGVWLARGL